jgi:hypothetical protein
MAFGDVRLYVVVGTSLTEEPAASIFMFFQIIDTHLLYYAIS